MCLFPARLHCPSYVSVAQRRAVVSPRSLLPYYNGDDERLIPNLEHPSASPSSASIVHRIASREAVPILSRGRRATVHPQLQLWCFEFKRGYKIVDFSVSDCACKVCNPLGSTLTFLLLLPSSILNYGIWSSSWLIFNSRFSSGSLEVPGGILVLRVFVLFFILFLLPPPCFFVCFVFVFIKIYFVITDAWSSSKLAKIPTVL